MVKGYARKKGVTVVMELGALPLIRCRAARIHQVIVNLLTNAIDACPAEGVVTALHPRPSPRRWACGSTFADNGSGIEPAIRERIFDPFFTTKPVGQGTGLGLAISYGIVQEHDGRIEVQSMPGEGSCFTVHLPIEPRERPKGDPLSLIPGLDALVDSDSTEESARLTMAAEPVTSSADAPSGELAHETRTDQLGLGPGRPRHRLRYRHFCLWRWIFKIAVDPLAPLTARGEEGAERENASASPGWNRWRLTKQQV